MTEQITPQMQTSTMLANLNNQLTQLDATQTEMSTGLQINQPSDNPYGTALSMQLNGQISALGSYTTNINDGTAWTSTASSSLQSIQQMVETVRSLVVEGANGTNSSGDLSADSDEVSQLSDAIKQAANTQYNGQYIFSGTATNTEPYATGSGSSDVFQGNTGAINRAIGPSTGLQINANLDSVLGSGATANDGGLLDTLSSVVSDLNSGNTAGLGTDLTNLDNNISSLEGVQATVGATQDRLQMASTRITSLQTTDQTELANVEDANIAQVATSFDTEQAGYQAALQSTAQIVQTSLMNFLST